MLDAKTISLVKSTVPLLENAGTEVTNYFYNRMFRAHPELKNIFNMSNQVSGAQQFALFSAVAAYAKHIDNLGELSALIERVAHKHASMYIKPEHYPIVGEHLIGTLKELLPNEFTPEVEDAWVIAYQFLANVLSNREEEIYCSNDSKFGGWRGERRFLITSISDESELVKNITLTPEDRKSVVAYHPGQFIGVKVHPGHCEYDEIRQYSLSDRPSNDCYRISVKKESIPQPGLVSNFFHDEAKIGDVVELYAPTGNFILADDNKPIVLISAGVGVTPMMSILEHLNNEKQNNHCVFLHACENLRQHSFKTRVQEIAKANSNVVVKTWYRHAAEGASFDGLMDLSDVQGELPLKEGRFYVCGPTAFMAFIRGQLLSLGVAEAQMVFETFGPHKDI
ncbi:MAG: NO-inducible flavohemoprotein [Alteromonadaceae bacterium]|nr:NO-inducible flavohemoprotein [Alteromonadaceae bacterium]